MQAPYNGYTGNLAIYNGYPIIQSSISIANFQALSGSLPLTYPCQGVNGTPYAGGGEIPAPPNTSGNFGTSISVTGNSTDVVVLQTAILTDSSGDNVPLNILNSTTDPNKLLPAFEGVAYPTSPLTPNMTYTVNLTGTYNGTPFTRAFTFTTGNTVA
jgi:hypothetical protein